MANKNTRALSARKGLDENLFEKISVAALSENREKEFQKIAEEFHLGKAVVAGTASFYDFLKEESRKHKVKVCNGTACMTAGTQEKLTNELLNYFQPDEIGQASCLGHCHSNYAFMYNGKTYSARDEKELQKILSEEIPSNKKYYVDSNTTAVLTGDIADKKAFFGQAQKFKSEKGKIIGELKKSGLRGRGGAGFPFWFKLDAVKKENASRKYIVCNADEGDPGAYSDMYLLEQQPLKVLYGMYISGLASGADTGVLYIRGEYPQSVESISNAISFLEENHLSPGFKWKIIKGQGSYICGEETALLSSIEGLRPEVRVRPPYPAQSGLYGKPTLVSNVETFANLHWILENGGDKYASLGTEKSTGTKLVSLDGFFNRPGIYEMEMGTPLSEIIEKYGLGFREEIKAVQVGGPLGGIVPYHKIKELNLDFESFDQAGFLLGHAGIVSIPKNFPMIKFIEHLLKFTADESCGKCYPCRIGSKRGYEMIKQAEAGKYKIDKKLLDDLLETLENGSLCALGGGVPLPVKNALEYFEEELTRYFN